MSSFDMGAMLALRRAAAAGILDAAGDCPNCGQAAIWFEDDMPPRSVRIHLKSGKESCRHNHG